MGKRMLVSIDTGMSSAVIAGIYSAEDPLQLVLAEQIEGGVEGFVERVKPSENGYGGRLIRVSQSTGIDAVLGDGIPMDVIVEKFTSRGAGNSGFSYRTSALESLRVEGAIIAMGIPHTYVSPQQQYFLPGKDKAEKKKRQHAWLKEHGYYIAPKDLGTKDADDARSACAHAISWLRRQKHKPTLELFREENDKLD